MPFDFTDAQNTRGWWEHVALEGFDVNLIGLYCELLYDVVEGLPDPWVCPFEPGCGARYLANCPLRALRASIAYANPTTRN